MHSFKNPVLVLKIILRVAVFVFVAASIRYSVHSLSWADLSSALQSVPTRAIDLAFLATAISYTILGAYDVFAVSSVSRHQSLGLAAFAGMTGNAVSNTLGFHALTGTALRYRFYNRAGMTPREISQVTILSFGFIGLGYVGILLSAAWFSDLHFAFAPHANHLIILLAVLLLTAVNCFIKNKEKILKIGRWSVPSLSAKNMLQMVLATIEMAAAIFALYILLPPDLAPSFPSFIFIYIGAVALGIVSHAPGGIGVFEAILLSALHAKGRGDVLAALLLYRFIYNFLPFCLACFAIAVFELGTRFNLMADNPE